MKPEPSEIVLETDRLILRLPTPDQFGPYLEMCADPETFRFSERGPMTSEEAWTRLLRHAGHWSLVGYGLFSIEEKSSGRFVGDAGFSDFRRQLGPRFDRDPEGGWSVAGWAQGRGYATEAVAAALEWMEAEFGTRRTVCLIHAQNAPSLRVAEKLGYVPFDEITYRSYPAILMERLRPASDRAPAIFRRRGGRRAGESRSSDSGPSPP